MKNNKTYIIGEIGINHCGSIYYAKKLINIAKKAGANAVKFQSYTTEKLIKKNSSLMTYQIKNIKKKISQFEMLKSCELTKEQHKILFTYCKKKKIEFISTPYDYENAKFLVKLGVKKIKVASTDTTNTPFIKQLQKLNKHLIISTGATSEKELRLVLNKLNFKKKKISILHCISNYPCPISDLNLNVLKNYRKKLKIQNIGFSDHSSSILSGSLAVCVGANIIEKHITLNKNLFGPDHKASLEPKEFQKYVSNIREAEMMLGNGKRNLTKQEKRIKTQMQKSLFLNKSIKKGKKISIEDFIIMRPATSIKPYFLNKILGKKTKKNLKPFTNIKLKNFI